MSRAHRSVPDGRRLSPTGHDGRAADRRRVGSRATSACCCGTTPTQVLAVHPGPIEFERAAVRQRRRGCCSAMPVPGAAHPRHIRIALGIIALEDLGDVTLQAHLGAASPAEHAALYREAVTLIDTLQRRGAELASPEYVPYGIAFDVEKLTWELQFFTKHFLEGVSRRRAARVGARGAGRRVRGHRRGAGRRAARAVSSRLSQPQPDAARGPPVHHRLPGRAHGTGHLRSGVAAARLVRGLHRSSRSRS